MRYHAVFFDAGRTLFAPYPSVGDIYASTAARYGCLDLDPRDLERRFTVAFKQNRGLGSLGTLSTEETERAWWRAVVQDVFSAFPAIPAFDAFFSELYDSFARAESWRVFPDVPEVLEHLRSRGVRLGVISNWDSRLRHILDELELSPYFETIVISALVGATKPHPQIFQAALERMGVGPHQAVHIGDNPDEDVKGPLALGMDAILIVREGPAPPVDGAPTVRSLREILPLVGCD